MNILYKKSGFTLVEMLVSIAIFMVVAVIAIAALLKIVDADRKSQTLQSTVNNISFAMDSITRELRVGSAYTCSAGAFSGPVGNTGTVCPSGIESDDINGSSIGFLSSNAIQNGSGGTCNLTYSYYFEPTSATTWTIEKAQQDPNYSGVKCTDSFNTNSPSSYNSDSYAPILDPSIVITSYALKVNNIGNSNAEPSSFLYISGYVGSTTASETHFDIQTTISQRI